MPDNNLLSLLKKKKAFSLDLCHTRRHPSDLLKSCLLRRVLPVVQRIPRLGVQGPSRAVKLASKLSTHFARCPAAGQGQRPARPDKVLHLHTRRPRPITGRHRAAGATGRPRLHGAGGKTCQVSRAAIRRHPQHRKPRRAPGFRPQGAGSPRTPASSRGRSLRGRSALRRRKAPPTPGAARAFQGAAHLR